MVESAIAVVVPSSRTPEETDLPQQLPSGPQPFINSMWYRFCPLPIQIDPSRNLEILGGTFDPDPCLDEDAPAHLWRLWVGDTQGNAADLVHWEPTEDGEYEGTSVAGKGVFLKVLLDGTYQITDRTMAPIKIENCLFTAEFRDEKARTHRANKMRLMLREWHQKEFNKWTTALRAWRIDRRAREYVSLGAEWSRGNHAIFPPGTTIEHVHAARRMMRAQMLEEEAFMVDPTYQGLPNDRRFPTPFDSTLWGPEDIDFAGYRIHGPLLLDALLVHRDLRVETIIRSYEFPDQMHPAEPAPRYNQHHDGIYDNINFLEGLNGEI